MKRIIKSVAKRVTWKRAKWLLKTNAQSWCIQGAIYGALALVGVGSLAAIVTAKVSAYVVFVGQCVGAARGGN